MYQYEYPRIFLIMNEIHNKTGKIPTYKQVLDSFIQNEAKGIVCDLDWVVDVMTTGWEPFTLKSIDEYFKEEHIGTDEESLFDMVKSIQSNLPKEFQQ